MTVMTPFGGILIIDDDALVARATQRVLRTHFHDVRIALDARQALSEFSRQVPAVVLADFESEDGTNEGLIRQLAHDFPRTRVVLYSASQPERWKSLVDNALIHTVLVKPCVDLKRLIDAVRAAASFN
jgi:DNA-binding NarL/FixJ family response regulator